MNEKTKNLIKNIINILKRQYYININNNYNNKNMKIVKNKNNQNEMVNIKQKSL